MDDLIEFVSDSDNDETLGEVPSNEQIVRNNKLKLLMWKDVTSFHSNTMKECKYYNEELNAIIKDCNIPTSTIKCMEWRCGLSVDTLPDNLKPNELSKCQLNLNRINPAKHLKICKNFTQPCTKSKDPPTDSNRPPSVTPNAVKYRPTQSEIVFNFKPNCNINEIDDNLPISNQKQVNGNFNKAPNTTEPNAGFETIANKLDGQQSSSEFNRRMVSNVPTSRSSKYFAKSSNATVPSNAGQLGNNFHGSARDISNQNNRPNGFNTPANRFNTPANGMHLNRPNGVNGNRPNGFNSRPNGFNAPAHRLNTPANGMHLNRPNGFNGNRPNRFNTPANESNEMHSEDPDDPFSFNNYYAQQANLGNHRRDRNVNGDNDKGTNLNMNKEKPGSFRTARTELGIQQLKKDKGKPGGNNQNYSGNQSSSWLSNNIKKTLGTTKTRSVYNKFVTPTRPNENEMDVDEPLKRNETTATMEEEEEELNEKYKGIDKLMIERIENEIMDQGSPVTWDDIAGLKFAKQTIQEVIVWPMLRPDIFTGLRRPPKGILLFGPPGTGKTLIGKCVAAQCRATFFCISASTLTSKWYGEGEKMVRALFAVASVHQPSIIFIDEIDSLLCQRSDQENETSRRLKTEFLISLDGAATQDDDRVLVIGATNRPQELDEAARRRLVKRLYIPLPDEEARCEIVAKLLANVTNSLTVEDIQDVGRLTVNFSGADMASLCREASLGPVRTIDLSKIEALDVRPISVEDFRDALKTVRPSVCQADLNVYQDWNQTFGSGRC